jgi:tetratricopeptide (TPR) repeat protein
MKRILTIFIFIFLTGNLVLADANQVYISMGNKAYQDGMYSNALGYYKKVTDAGYQSADLFYNIGNVYFKLNDLSHAILYYERARRLDPGSEDINFNLNVANSRIADKIESIPEMFYLRWFHGVARFFVADTWAVLSIVLFVLTLIAFLGYFILPWIIFRKAGFWSGLVFLILFLFALFFSWQSYYASRSKEEAIIFEPTVTVKSSPDEKSIDLFVLHEGTKVEVKDRIGEWFEIKIPNGSIGWLPVNTVEKI